MRARAGAPSDLDEAKNRARDLLLRLAGLQQGLKRDPASANLIVAIAVTRSRALAATDDVAALAEAEVRRAKALRAAEARDYYRDKVDARLCVDCKATLRKKRRRCRSCAKRAVTRTTRWRAKNR